MKDVAYFLGSCLSEPECAAREQELLARYFDSLRGGMAASGIAVDADARSSRAGAHFPVAWADFHRFLKGWSPGHWKLNDYSERLTREVVTMIR